MNSNKLAVVVGRFSHITLGHKRLIDAALEQAENVLVLVGSAQAKNVFRNPFSVETRVNALKLTYAYQPRVYVGWVPDYSSEVDISPEWGDHILAYIKDWAGHFNLPTDRYIMVYGNDENRSDWFRWLPAEDMARIHFHSIERSESDISATNVRFAMANDWQDEWKKNVPIPIHHLYDKLREELLQTLEYKQIASAIDTEGITTIFQLMNPTDGQIRSSYVSKTLGKGTVWFFNRNNWCYSAGVAILPFRTKEDGEREYLVRMELCPAHSDEIEMGAIMGGYDKARNVSMAGHALAELHEEAGYIAHESHLDYLGTIRPEKSSDTTHYLYAIDLDQPGIKKDVATGDGSEIEKLGYTKWVTERELAFSKMSSLSCMLLRLKHLKHDLEEV